jgi:glycosyltransferase involved in cell wall biosynthesis
MSLIEAGAAGVPIVTTEVGIAKTELFKDTINSYVCGVGETDHIAKHIAELLSDPAKRNLFKHEMQDSIKAVAISKEEYISKYVSLLEKLL